MKRTLVLSVAALTLTACGQSDREVIVAACTEDDNTPEFCECMTDAMYESFSPELMKEVAKGIRSGQESPEEVMADLPEAKNPLTMMSFAPRLMACAE